MWLQVHKIWPAQCTGRAYLICRLQTCTDLARDCPPNFVQTDNHTSGHLGEDLAGSGLDKFADCSTSIYKWYTNWYTRQCMNNGSLGRYTNQGSHCTKSVAVISHLHYNLGKYCWLDLLFVEFLPFYFCLDSLSDIQHWRESFNVCRICPNWLLRHQLPLLL